MSHWGRIQLILSIFFLLALLGIRYVLSGWVPLLFIPLAGFIISFAVGIIIDRKFYQKFLTMKTTKHGMNMGSLIFMAIVIVVLINIFSFKFNKVLDFTENQLYTLAPQTLKLLDEIKLELNIYVFYKGAKPPYLKQRVDPILELFSQASSKVKIHYMNAYNNPVFAEKYLKGIKNFKSQKFAVLIDYKSKKAQVLPPYEENDFTKSMVVLTRQVEKKIYFLEGHSERSVNSAADDPAGLTELKSTLEEYSFKVESIDLLKSQVPMDMQVLAIVGPRAEFQEKELEIIKEANAKGVHLLFALDPGKSHNLSKFLLNFGIYFKSNYILDPNSSLGQSVVISKTYNQDHEITKNIEGKITVFPDVSEVVAKSESVKPLVYSAPGTFSVKKMVKQEVKVIPSSLTLGVVSKAKSNRGGIVVYGDSDFLANDMLYKRYNRDLALNTFAYLSKEKDLISIRPKAPRLTTIMMSKMEKLSFIGFSILAPILLWLIAIGLWLHRRKD